jgi:hypothetical protein
LGYDTKDLWRYTDAIRKVFSQEKRPELALFSDSPESGRRLNIDRGLLVKEWAKAIALQKYSVLKAVRMLAEATRPTET